MSTPFVRLCLLLAPVLPVLSQQQEGGILPTALAADDACSQHPSAEGDQCALSALQRRVAKTALLSGTAASRETEDNHPIMKLEIFRPLHIKNLDKEMSNVDMFSIQGLLHYLHTQVVWEHKDDEAGTEPPRMHTRAEDVNAIVGINANVRNPNSVIEEVGEVNNFVDFAAIALFVGGEATGPGYNWDYGDIVGTLSPRDRAYPAINPYYRFSFSGYCPNLKSEYKLKPTKHSGSCVKYSDHYDLPQGEILQGGLCPNGTEPGKLPTGLAGCSYTYTPPAKANVTSLDKLVGITSQDCGGRNCENWRDFRLHCTNRKYHMKFNYVDRHRHSKHRRRRSSLLETNTSSKWSSLVRTKFCVEYDIVKPCAHDCFSPECRKIPPHKREVGLPFWKGRCDPVRNAQRAEKLAVAMGIADATKDHDLLRNQATETCVSDDPKAMCHPQPESGGMYCSRAWGGVCQPCYIPGTVEFYKHNKTTTTCPWNVLTSGQDYTNPAFRPKCATNLPQDYCCLYTNSCDPALIADAQNISMPATEDGFAYASFMQNTQFMQTFLQRAAMENASIDVSGIKGFSEFAYWKWVGRPVPGATLERVVAEVKKHAH